jgi:hypothetical protein
MPSNRPAIAPFLTAAALITFTACGSEQASLTERQAAVAEAGAEVMPFNLDDTTHIFTDTATGGIQDVVADDVADQTNIELIRRHLHAEAAKFRVGDFSDPEAIHGPAMPGLSILEERFGEISVTLIETDLGATITYSTDDADVVDAIHAWFAAQTSDHDDHAE